MDAPAQEHHESMEEFPTRRGDETTRIITKSPRADLEGFALSTQRRTGDGAQILCGFASACEGTYPRLAALGEEVDTAATAQQVVVLAIGGDSATRVPRLLAGQWR